MKKHTKSVLKITISAVLMTGVFGAQATELNQKEQKALDQYNTMQALPFEERKAFRQNLFSGMSEDERDAFKLAVDKGLNASRKTNTAKSSFVRVPGTSITYDNGMAAGPTGQSSFMQGNLFNSGVNGLSGSVIEPVETSGSVTQVVFDMAQVDNGAAFFSIFSAISGTQANVVTSVNIPGLVTGLNTHTFTSPVAYSNGPFLAGIWQFGSEAVNVSTGTVNGQGFHGIEINDVAGTGLNTALTLNGSPVNAILRVSGDVLQGSVPVELIDFSIETND